jgi:hypothetical protein
MMRIIVNNNKKLDVEREYLVPVVKGRGRLLSSKSQSKLLISTGNLSRK